MVSDRKMSQGNSPSPDDEDGKTSLIVNYLPKNFNQEDMRALFSTVGQVESCTLMRDKEERCSLGYGFVNFRSQEDAQKAIDELNGFKLESKIIKVSYARPCSDAIKGTNIYVAGLPCQISSQDLVAIFQNYGTIIDHRILRPNMEHVDINTARSAALIRYDKRAEALLAIDQCNGKTPHNLPSTLIVKFANSPKIKAQKRSLMEFMSVDHRPGKMMVPMNKSYPQFPPIVHPCPPMMGNGFHPEMKMPRNANHFQPYPPPPPPPQEGDSWPLFVYNLNTTVEERDLWQLFGPFGAIKGIRVIKDKGFAFVNMLHRVEAEVAIHSLDGSSFKERTIQVSFKVSKNK